MEIGFRQSLYDHCLFIYDSTDCDGDDIECFIGLYVDDGILIGKDKAQLRAVMASIKDSFKLTVTDDVKKFLGIEITVTSTEIQLHEQNYIFDVVKKFGLEYSRGADIPLNPAHNLEPDLSTYRHDPTLKYQELIGALLFISRCTRPDIAFAVNKLSRYFQCYEEKHMKAAKDVLRYLDSTSNLGLGYQKKMGTELLGYSDADYAGDKSGLRSTSGIIYMLNGSPLSWISKRQTLIAQSSTESEYVALATAGKEGIWLRNLLCDMKILKWTVQFGI